MPNGALILEGDYAFKTVQIPILAALVGIYQKLQNQSRVVYQGAAGDIVFPMNKFSIYLTKIIIFLFPLFFLPVTRDFFVFNKNILLIFFALSLAAIFLLKITLAAFGQIKRNESPPISFYLSIFLSPLTLPILAIAAAYLLSLLISSPNKVEALLQPGGAGTIFALTLMYFLIKHRSIVLSPLLASSIILSLITIIFTALDSFGLKTLSFADFQITTAGFTPAGSLLSLVSFLLVSLVISLTRRRENHAPTATNHQTSIFHLLPSLIILLGLLSAFSSMVRPENKPLLLPVSAGWQIAVENFKTPKTALFGVGPGNFINAFTRAKPLALNQGALWPFRFGLSSNFYFQVLTEVGILGLAALVWLLWRLNLFEVQPLKIPLLAIFLILALIPANILLLFVLYLSLAAASDQEMRGDKFASESLFDEHHEVERGVDERAEFRPRVALSERFQQRLLLAITLPLILLITLVFYLLSRAYAAEVTIFHGLRAAAANRAQETYDLQREALRLNPYSSDYRLIFAQTNLALANNMAANPDLTDVDRQTISQLVNQTIVNAKLAVQLTPAATTWENLAAIYRALVNVAQGADAWAVASYNQAVTLDPANPGLRVAFGGLYYALQVFDPAIRQFETAIFLKRDFANAWYNLATAQRETQRIDQARFSYQQTLALLDPASNDYQQVKTELEALPKPPEATPSAQALETLSPPATAGAELEPPLELGEEAAPEITPFASPRPQLSPSPSL